ncbi:MAG TPA: hypothetical protein DEF61_03840 [Firmicutes bacterium]|nr:hypothetical protein [Bacillota bacterium]
MKLDVPHQIVEGHRFGMEIEGGHDDIFGERKLLFLVFIVMILKTFVAERLSMDPPFSKYTLMSFAKILAKS